MNNLSATSWTFCMLAGRELAQRSRSVTICCRDAEAVKRRELQTESSFSPKFVNGSNKRRIRAF
jgi:hypothetical protein